MFLELYYKDYPNLCEPSRRSLPYSIMIRSPEQRKMFEEMQIPTSNFAIFSV